MSVASPSTRISGQFNDAELDLSALGTTLWRKKWKILLPALLVGLVTLAAVQVITPKYLAEARIMVESRDNIYLRPDVDKDLIDRNVVDQEAVTSHAQLILSREVANQVIAKLKLNQLPEFDATLGGGISPVRAVLGVLGITKNPMSMTPEERVLEAYYDRLTVYPVEKSRVIVIDFLSEDPELAANVTNAIAEAYLDVQRKAKQDQARAASQWLAGEIESMRKKVVDAESRVAAYRAKSNLLIGNNNTTLSAQQLGDLNSQLAAARAQKADAEAKAKLIRDMLKSGQPIESADIVNSELIRRLSEQRVTLRAQLAEQSSSLLDNHPRIKELRAQIADLDRQITAEAATIARSLDNDARIAGARVDSLSANLDQLKSQAAATNVEDVQLRELERDAKSQRDLLESYLAKFREASARDSLGAAAPDARIISTAAVSTTPAWPKKLPTILVAALAVRALIGDHHEQRASSRRADASRRRHRGSGFDAGVRVPAGSRSNPRCPSRKPRARRRERADGDARAAGARAERSRGGRSPDLRYRRSAQRRHHHDRDCARAQPRPALQRRPRRAAGYLTQSLGDRKRPRGTGLVRARAGSGHVRPDHYARSLLACSSDHGAGCATIDAAALMQSPQLSIAIEALARSYDHVLIDAGAADDIPLERFVALAPRAVMVADDLGNPATTLARERLLKAGFVNVNILADAPPLSSETGTTGAKAAA